MPQLVPWEPLPPSSTSREAEDFQSLARLIAINCRDNLTTLLLMLDQLEKPSKEGLAPRTRRIEFAQKSAVRIQQLVRILGELPHEVDSAIALQSALEAVSKRKGFPPVVHCVSSLPRILGCPNALSQLFQNLLENLLEMENGVAPQTISIGARSFNEHWEFYVAGAGSFESSLQWQGARETPAHRNIDSIVQDGPGLSLCRKIVELRGGTLWMESATNSDMAFKFTWPKIA